jgi:hypothetical protein
MSLKTKIATAAVAALTLGTAALMPTGQAQAKSWGLGIGLGIAAGAIVGASVASNYGYGYGGGYYGPRCRFVRQYDAYGYYMGASRVCGY